MYRQLWVAGGWPTPGNVLGSRAPGPGLWSCELGVKEATEPKGGSKTKQRRLLAVGLEADGGLLLAFVLVPQPTPHFYAAVSYPSVKFDPSKYNRQQEAPVLNLISGFLQSRIELSLVYQVRPFAFAELLLGRNEVFFRQFVGPMKKGLPHHGRN